MSGTLYFLYTNNISCSYMFENGKCFYRQDINSRVWNCLCSLNSYEKNANVGMEVFFSQSRLQKETIRVKVTLPAWHQLKHPECFLNNITIIIFVSPCTNFHSHNFIQLATSFLNGLIYTDSFCFVLYLFWYSYMFFYPIYFLHLTHIGFYLFCKYLFGHLQSLPSLQKFITDCPTSTTYLTAIPNHQIYLFASFSTPTQTVRCGGRGFYFFGFWSLIQSCYV